MKKFTKQEVIELYGRVTMGEISFSRMVEILNERVSEAEKSCVADIPVRKFKKGDKVMLKSGYKKDDGEITYDKFFDRYIDKPLTVVGYTMNGYISLDEHIFPFSEDWLEPYVEELKKGDLAIFWDETKGYAIIRFYDQLDESDEYLQHKDNIGFHWDNAVKFESIEQYRKLLKGEI